MKGRNETRVDFILLVLSPDMKHYGIMICVIILIWQCHCLHRELYPDFPYPGRLLALCAQVLPSQPAAPHQVAFYLYHGPQDGH